LIRHATFGRRPSDEAHTTGARPGRLLGLRERRSMSRLNALAYLAS
jgi:hypothetical protein